MAKKLVLATRNSALAMWQAEYVKGLLEAKHTDLQVEILGMTTQGDQILDVTLSKIGGKGLFIKELEVALLSGQADIAVHSMKDVPMSLPEGLEIAALCERANPYDAFVSAEYHCPQDLPHGAKVGTSSLRRSCQLKKWRPDLNISFLRGNVQTRLKKLDNGEYNAIILACAGLERLGLSDRIRYQFDDALMLPATGQGAVGIECRSDDARTQAILSSVHDAKTALCVGAERALNARLNGGCHAPVAVFASFDEMSRSLSLEARVGSVDGAQLLCVRDSMQLSGTTLSATEKAAVEAMAHCLAKDLKSQGAETLIADALAASS